MLYDSMGHLQNRWILEELVEVEDPELRYTHV